MSNITTDNYGGYYALLITATVYMYISVAVYGVRTTMLLLSLVKLGRVNVNPLHPDRSGGLSFLGELGVQNVYPIVVIGFNLALVTLSDVVNLDKPLVSFYHLLLAVSYLTAAVTVFFLPLSAFYRPMRRRKDSTLASLGSRSQRAYEQLQDAADPAAFDTAMEEIGRIEAMHKIAISMPVWPFSFSMVRTFALSVSSPFIAGLIGQLLKLMFSRGG